MIGDNIRKIREANKLGLNETARRAGISAGYLSSLERGEKKNPSMDSLKKIADALGVSVNDFFDDKYNINEDNEFNPTLSVKEQKKLDKQAQDIVNNLSVSLSKNKNSLEDEDYEILQASISAALQSLTLKNKKKFTPKKYRVNKKKKDE
ncbi:helix-turn-helix domain-containing protein [Clostridium sp. MT-14]|uniref:helix-turn-helix domain-containing protein n=1 Tax=unclassified Clostridium TaxID=2614128 RepID=UPI00123AABE1|nr:helix-turn-helix transcriptional regulator [Clostridium sp. HV4-5-A1G]KAA8669002.1 helix-turn-helix transcriptional regulator [Clostridium sp. HV4-5-A1G]CAB1249751.1 HTH-type transcriptional regulator SinR [Clostridiaceae bacterium BL-3]